MEVVVPDLGDFADVEVVDVLVRPGDQVRAEDPLITLETDKASIDVPSPAAGTVRELKVDRGDRVSTGHLVLLLDTDGESADKAKKQSRGEDADSETDSPADDESASASALPGEDRSHADDESGTTSSGESSNNNGGQDATESERIVTVPDLGDFTDVEIVDVLVAEGDDVEAEQGLIALETEKAMVEVPAPVAGRVLTLKIARGDRVSTGDEVAVLLSREAPAPKPAGGRASESTQPDIDDTGPDDSSRRYDAGSSSRPAAPARQDQRRAERGVAALTPINEKGFARAHASPSVRKLARELGVDLSRVEGSGRKGRVTADDVKAFVKRLIEDGTGPSPLPTVPEVDFSRFGPVDLEPLSRVQKISGPRLHASWINVPHVTHHEEADITEMEERRQALKDEAADRNIRLTPLAFILRACVLTLEEFPRFKSSLSPDGEHLVRKHYTHIGFAADTPKGLLVPVIHDADKKDVYELASALAELSARARDGRLSPNEMQGGVFTVSSLGGIGGTAFTPIINAPEVAILGVSRHQWRPVYRDGGFVPRLMLPLSLSYDHRVIDGAEAARFAARLAQILADSGRLLEAIP